MREIITIPDPILYKKSEPITDFGESLQSLIAEMEAILQADPHGVGLSAPQVGISKRLILVTAPGKNHEITSLVNPEITFYSKEIKEDYEGCLSIPYKVGLINRSVKLKVRAQDKTGRIISLRAANFFARQIQHEIDHLEGILFTDRTTADKVFDYSVDNEGRWIIEKPSKGRMVLPDEF